MSDEKKYNCEDCEYYLEYRYSLGGGEVSCFVEPKPQYRYRDDIACRHFKDKIKKIK